MTNTQKSIAILGLIVLLGVLYGAYQFPVAQQYTTTGVSTGTTTNTSAKRYTVTIAPLSATTTSLYNSDGTDRGIIDVVALCTGVGTSQNFTDGAGLLSNAWNVKAATTSTANNGLQGNTSNIFKINLATTTPTQYGATSTTPFPTDVTRIWPAGTYLTFWFSATNTAACTVGADAMSL